GLGRPCGRGTWPPSGASGNNRRGSTTRLTAAALAGSGASREPQGSRGQEFAEDACRGDPSHGSTSLVAQGSPLPRRDVGPVEALVEKRFHFLRAVGVHQ